MDRAKTITSAMPGVCSIGFLQAVTSETFHEAFAIPPKFFGRVERLTFAQQIQFEGWMIGVR
jgi:hypothetical protein